jgi:malonate decarboxylase alpha subunit
MKNWNAQRTSLTERLADGSRYASGKTVEAADLSNFLQAVIRPGDRVCLEGDNQKQADVLAAALADIDPAKVHDLHMIQSGVVLPEHLDVFDKGVARRLDYSYSGPQAARIARMLFGGKIELGAVLGAARAVRLAVNVASHTPRLAAASSEFRKILDQTPTKLAPDSNVRLFSGIDGSPVVNISAGLNKLAKQISHTVQWAHCLEGCVEAGASVFFELGPGRALNEMAAGAYPDISARSLEDFRTLQGARAWLARVVN